MLRTTLTPSQREQIIKILCEAFDANKSVNFVIKQDAKRAKRLQTLMKYSLFKGEQAGRVYLNKAENTCAIVLNSSIKTTSLKSIIWDIRLVISCIGISNVFNVLKRERELKKLHPSHAYMHLWYIGVLNSSQGKGLGSELLQEIIKQAKQEKLPIYLETSTARNFPFYEKNGFETLNTLTTLGYILKIFYKK